MSQNAQSAAKPRSAWIISPTFDMAYLVATPLAIVPAVWLLARWSTPEQIFLVVAAFATFGHHLPGFMRCYGDRELFERFRWRFVLAPPLFLLIALVFTLQGLHGLTLVLLVWGTWHGLMQTYGFMRIYDLKRGVRDAYSAQLDFWLCLSIFTAGMVYSDARVAQFMEAFWRSGMPSLDPVWLIRLRWTTGVAVGLVFAAYVVNLIRVGLGFSWIKVLLAMTTGSLFWLCGAVTTNVLIGVAMFEIFHAIQYYAIVWTYNRRLAERVGERFGPLGFMFQDRWFFLGIYLTAIFLFSSFRLFGNDMGHPYLNTIVLAMVSTSTLLHFYFDGFIWKVSERKTQVNLDIEASLASPLQISVPALTHVAKWAMLLVMFMGLIALERPHKESPPADDSKLIADLASWTPELPEVQSVVSRAALHRGDTDEAIRLAREVVRKRPRMADAHAHLGTTLLQGKQYAAAADAFREAIRLSPDAWENHYDLSRALSDAKRHDEAIATARETVKQNPQSSKAHEILGTTLNNAGKYRDAIAPLETSLRLDATVAEVYYQLGLANIQIGQTKTKSESVEWFEHARKLLKEAIDLDEAHAQAQYQMGNVHYLTGSSADAARHYQRCIDLSPDHIGAYKNLASVLFEMGKIDQAIATYQRAVKQMPNNADCHFNLGMLYVEQQKLDDARRHVRRAIELGYKPSDEVLDFLGL